ncbi:MAG: hypothetical protein CME36_12255 [unclassified Hahellaceae]|nr:hypothetical protein [Hahellaceae bacterium]|tara:strand:- start:126980 stop:128182 length:1203 start_codon:yes stop_codon:yes gene_type:complete
MPNESNDQRKVILVALHTPVNTGYAIEPLERLFFETALELTAEPRDVLLSYADLSSGRPHWLDDYPNERFPDLDTDQIRVLEAPYRDESEAFHERFAGQLREAGVNCVIGFDLQVNLPVIRAMRKGGAKRIATYWGAPMSSLNSGLKLLLKRVEVALRRYQPDHYLFESYGMQDTAVRGRGIPKKRTGIVRLGVDPDRYTTRTTEGYLENEFNIPDERKTFFYAGHMEARKGVHVIVQALAHVVNELGRKDIHVLICGNKGNEAETFDKYYKGTRAVEYLTFGGYRSDIATILPNCYASIIASTGWDSFPRSSLEMAVSGLPLLVSNLPGLNETVDPGDTGFLFETGNYKALAERMVQLADDPALRQRMSRAAVARVHASYTVSHQRENFRIAMQRIFQW